MEFRYIFSYWTGFSPLFVDISLNTLAICPDKLEYALKRNPDVRAVFLTHAQGLNGLQPRVLDLCQQYKVLLIEDVCESHGVMVDGIRKAGTVGSVSCFSFYYAHHISTIEGGMIVK